MSEKLYQIVASVMNVHVSQINDDSGAENLESWDSFNVYVLLDEIESAFDVKFDLAETLEINKVNDLKRLLKKHQKI